MGHIPYINIGPGEIVERSMDALNMSNMDLSKELGIPLEQVNLLLNNKLKVTLILANRLSRVFNTSSQYWLNLYNNYMNHPSMDK